MHSKMRVMISSSSSLYKSYSISRLSEDVLFEYMLSIPILFVMTDKSRK